MKTLYPDKRASLNSRPFLWFVVLAVLGVAVYWNGLDGKRFGDDFKLLFDSPSSKIFYFFANPNPHQTFYRPVESMILATIQTVAGSDTRTIHILVLAMHVVLAWIVILAALDLGFTMFAAAASGSYMLISQANALAVLSNDTLSQVGGTLFGSLALWWYWKSLVNDSKTMNRRLYFISLVAFVLSLLMKETSLGFLPSIFLISVLVNKGPVRKRVLHGAALSVPFIAVTILYMVVRLLVVNAEGASRYDVGIGLNVLANIGLSFVSVFIPTASVDVYAAVGSYDWSLLIPSGIGASFVIGICVHSLWHSPSKDSLRMLMLLAFASLAPAVLIAHVSELYVYAGMPLFSMVIGGSLAASCERLSTRGRRIVLAGAAIVACSHVLAIQAKTTYLLNNGERASILIERILPYMPLIPTQGTLVLVTPESGELEYSVYKVNGFNVLRYGENVLRIMSGRNDVSVWVMNEMDLERWPPPDEALRLILGTENNIRVLD